MAATKRGTTFLIEGAPGAGKSALLAECGDLADQSGWLVPGGIPVKSLHDTDEMRRVVDGVRKLKFLRGNLGGWGLGWAGGSTISSPHHVLGKGKKPLLLVLDEAQRLHALTASLPGSDARLAMGAGISVPLLHLWPRSQRGPSTVLRAHRSACLQSISR